MNTVQREAIEKAKTRILEYLKEPTRGQTKGHLMRECNLEAGQFVWANGSGLPHSRVLDRALQQLRKVGLIQFQDGGWSLYQPEPPLTQEERHLLQPFLKSGR